MLITVASTQLVLAFKYSVLILNSHLLSGFFLQVLIQNSPAHNVSHRVAPQTARETCTLLVFWTRYNVDTATLKTGSPSKSRLKCAAGSKSVFNNWSIFWWMNSWLLSNLLPCSSVRWRCWRQSCWRWITGWRSFWSSSSDNSSGSIRCRAADWRLDLHRCLLLMKMSVLLLLSTAWRR